MNYRDICSYSTIIQIILTFAVYIAFYQIIYPGLNLRSASVYIFDILRPVFTGRRSAAGAALSAIGSMPYTSPFLSALPAGYIARTSPGTRRAPVIPFIMSYMFIPPFRAPPGSMATASVAVRQHYQFLPTPALYTRQAKRSIHLLCKNSKIYLHF